MNKWVKKNWLALVVLVIVVGYIGNQQFKAWQWREKLTHRTASSPASQLPTSDKDGQEKVATGMSLECIRQERQSDRKLLDSKIEKQQEELKNAGVMSHIIPTKGQLGANKRLAMNGRKLKAVYPKPGVDILAQLGVILDNQWDGEFGVTEEAVRGMADRAYDKLPIADKSLRGWTLSMRPGSGSFTDLDEGRKVATIQIEPTSFDRNAEHELMHFLSGPAFVKNDAVVRVAVEFVAIAAESVDPSQDFRDAWSYALMNRSILGMARNINGVTGVIHAAGAPLDGMRYDLLRLTDEVIGEDGQVKLALAIYRQALDHKKMTLNDFGELMKAAGVKDLALLNRTLDPGLYLDLAFMKTGIPVMLAKTVDSDGYEGISQVPEQFIWRDEKGDALANGDPTPLQPMMILGDAADMAVYASSLEVRVSGEPYLFSFVDSVSNTTSAGKMPSANSINSVR